MNYRNMIENKIKEIESGKFQMLCNDLLSCLGYGKVSNSGGQIGTDKTIKGTPDAYILLESKFIFIEYTTQQTEVFNKFKEDIRKCLDEKKTGVKNTEKNKIIIAYNSKLKASELSALSNICNKEDVEFEYFDIDKISNYIFSEFPYLAKDYLDLALDSQQFLNCDKFIKLNDTLMMSTPLGLSCVCRDSSILDIKKEINENNIVIISGETGIGKTKIICEVLKELEKERIYDNIWFIKDRGKSIYEELTRYTSIGKHIIFLDDINKSTILDEILQYVSENSKRIKLVSTVRSYALNSTKEKINKYASAKIYKLEKLVDEDITKIIKTNFNIHNNQYIEHINKLAKGNVRLAVMMAKINDEKSIYKNVADILDRYYEFLRKKLNGIDDELQLKALGALSFFDKLHFKDEKSIELVSKITMIESFELKRIYQQLSCDEIINIYEDEVVEISDQIVSAFIFRYVYESRKLLSYTKVLEVLFPKYRNRIVQNINAVNAYYENIDYFKNEIKKIWRKWKIEDNSKFREFVLTFWFVYPEKTLLYISNEIKNYKQNKELQADYLYSGKDNLEIDQVLNVLGQFVNNENKKAAIDLAIKYLENDYTKIKEVSMMFLHYYGYKTYSFEQNYKIQNILVDSIIKHVNKGNEIFMQLYVNIAINMISYFVEVSEWKNEKELSFCSFEICNSDGMKELRTKLWSKCKDLIANDNYSKYALDLVKNYGVNGRASSDKTLYELDLILIEENVVSVLKLENLENYIFMYKIGNLYKHLIGRGFSQIESVNSEVSSIYKFFKMNAYDFDKKRKIGETKLENYQTSFARNLKKENFSKFMEACNEIDKIDKDKTSNADVIIIIMKNVESLSKFIEEYFIANTPFQIYPRDVIELMIKEVGYLDLRKLVKKYDFDMKEIWEYFLYSFVPEKSIDEDLFNDMKKYYESIEHLCINYSRDLTFLEKYKKMDDNIFIYIVKIIKSKKDAMLKNVYFNQLIQFNKDIDKLISEFKDDKKLLEDIYVEKFKKNKIYDPKGIICRKFIEINEELIYKIIDILSESKCNYPLNEDITFDYSILWEYDSDIITSFCIYIIDNKIEFAHENKLDNIFLSSEVNAYSEKRNLVLLRLIAKYVNSEKETDIIFYLIANFNDDVRIKYYLEFLKYNANIESFKKIPKTKSSYSWSGSEIPMLTKKKHFILELLNSIQGIEFLEHRSYLRDMICYYEEQIKKIKIEEHMRDY